VIAHGTSHCPDCAPISQATESTDSFTFAKIAFLSLLAHFCLALAVVLLDPLSFATDRSQIPVEVVIAQPQPLPTLSAVQVDPPDNKWPAKENREVINKPDAGIAGGEGDSAKERQPMPIAAGAAFDAAPYNFRTFAGPVTTANGSEATNYQFVVGGMLERAKQYPESAVRRGAKGTATIGFVLDQSGGVAAVSLLRSSGEADLDSEGLALVRRAAPFPPPPPGAKRSFAIKVAFGISK
jgi:TonB family protein